MDKVKLAKRILLDNCSYGDSYWYVHNWICNVEDKFYIVWWDENSNQTKLIGYDYKGNKLLEKNLYNGYFSDYEMIYFNEKIHIVAIIYGGYEEDTILKYFSYDLSTGNLYSQTLKNISYFSDFGGQHLSNFTIMNGKLYIVVLIPDVYMHGSIYNQRYKTYIYEITNVITEHLIDYKDNKLKHLDVYSDSYFGYSPYRIPMQFYYYNMRFYSCRTMYLPSYHKFFFNNYDGYFGNVWSANTTYPSNTFRICPNWIPNMAYEPSAGYYNGNLPQLEHDYNLGDIIRYYDGNWQNIYYDTRNDIILKCASPGKSGSDYPNLKTKIYGDSFFWGTAIFTLYYARSYTIACSASNTLTTGSSQPIFYTYGTLIGDGVYDDGTLKMSNGQVRPLRWISETRYYRSEYIIENGKIFYVYQVPSTDPYKSGITGSSKPPFDTANHYDEITDGTITWKCFDPVYAFYYPPLTQFLPNYNEEEYLDDLYFYYKCNYNAVPSNMVIRVVKESDLNVYYDLTPDSEYKFKYNSYNFNDTFFMAVLSNGLGTFERPLIYRKHLYNIPNLTKISSTNNYLYINFANNADFNNDPTCPGKPYDTVILDNNLNILFKKNYLPMDDENPSETRWYQTFRIPKRVDNYIFFSENDWNTWEEKIRRFTINIDGTLTEDWSKSLPEETTYNDNWFYILTNTNKLQFFFNYNTKSFLIKEIDLNGENGKTWQLYVPNAMNMYKDVFTSTFFIVNNDVMIPAYYSFKGESGTYLVIFTKAKGGFFAVPLKIRESGGRK